MARVYCNNTQKMSRRFNDFVRGELRRQHIKQERLAEYLNLSRPALTHKLNSVNAWTLEQALDAVEFLEGDFSEIFK